MLYRPKFSYKIVKLLNRDAKNTILNTQNKAALDIFFCMQRTNSCHLAVVALSECQEVMEAR